MCVCVCVTNSKNRYPTQCINFKSFEFPRNIHKNALIESTIIHLIYVPKNIEIFR